MDRALNFLMKSLSFNVVKSSAAKIGYRTCLSLIISHNVAILGMLPAVMNPAINSALADASKTKDQM